MRVFVQKLDGSVEPCSLPMAFSKEKPSREDFRNQVTSSPLGDAKRDIFFPFWTLNPIMIQSESIKDSTPTWDEIEQCKITVDSEEKLHELLDKEELCPGSTALIVQQTRSKRYSRKKDEQSGGQGHGNNNPEITKTRRGLGNATWDAHRYYNFQGSPPFSPTGISGTSGPVYYDSAPYMHVGVLGPMSHSQAYFSSYPPQCFAVPINLNFTPTPNQFLMPAAYTTGQFF